MRLATRYYILQAFKSRDTESMAKSKQSAVSDRTKEEAMQVAKSTQKPGQTKEQTKLIAQGIQKGIDQYKKQQKAKSRELDKQRKKKIQNAVADSDDMEVDIPTAGSKLPWILLLLSWALFIAYVMFV